MKFSEKESHVGKMEIGDYVYQGDVVIKRCEHEKDFPTWPRIESGIVMQGSATSNVHKLFGDFDLRENPETKQKFVRLHTPTWIKHQEHNKMLLPAGDFKIEIQTEEDHIERKRRQIAD